MNVFANLPAQLPDELTEVLVQSPRVRIERIVSQGHASPTGFWYDQAEHEFVLLLQGAARLRYEDSERELQPGDWVHLPAHCRHRVEWTAPHEQTIWLAIFYS